MPRIPNPLECPCHIIAEPLPADFDLTTLDHVCPLNAYRSVRHWAHHERARAHHIITALLSPLAGDDVQPAAPFIQPKLLLDGLDQWLRTTSTPYPFPTPHGPLALVIRQAIAVPESATILSRQLQHDDRWITAQARLWDHIQPGSPSMLDAASDTRLAHIAAGILQSLGLPDSRPAADALIAAVFGRPMQRPAHGAHVITYVYAADANDQAFTTLRSSSRFTVEGTLDYATDKLFEAVSTTLRAHRDWIISRFGAIDTLATPSAKGRAASPAQSRDPSHPRFDPVAEALAPHNLTPERIAQFRTRARHRAGRDALLTPYLAQIGARVRDRLRRAGLPARLPRGWTAEARRQIHAVLDAHPES